jgi:CDP-diglyceride synthetase
MTCLLAGVSLKLREIAPIYFVPMVALLVLLAQREIIRARTGPQRRRQLRTVTHVLNLAVFPLMVLLILIAGLRAYAMLG